MPDTEATPAEAIRRYHHGFASADAEVIRASIGPTYFMASGNFSNDPADWQAHMFLGADDIDEWIAFMLGQAGPHSNAFETLSSHTRGDAALVVTSDAGSNKFRSWKDQLTVWQVARIDADWRIVGYFVRDLVDPD